MERFLKQKQIDSKGNLHLKIDPSDKKLVIMNDYESGFND